MLLHNHYGILYFLNKFVVVKIIIIIIVITYNIQVLVLNNKCLIFYYLYLNMVNFSIYFVFYYFIVFLSIITKKSLSH